jgi:hypothetical protein
MLLQNAAQKISQVRRNRSVVHFPTAAKILHVGKKMSDKRGHHKLSFTNDDKKNSNGVNLEDRIGLVWDLFGLLFDL